MKKGKFALRLWAIRKLIESLMMSEIDRYEGKTIVARRTKKWLKTGVTINKELVEATARMHSAIVDAFTKGM